MEDRAGEAEDPGGSDHRAGFVAILGPPNAGKSTLMNRLLGEKLAIVTAKPQTTRSRILGIHSIPGAQILFVDTPGLHESSKLLNTALNEAVNEAVRSCDLGVVLVDTTEGFQDVQREILAALKTHGKPWLLVGTKVDLPGSGKPWLPDDLESIEHADVLGVSGLTGEGVKELETRIAEKLPPSPPLYPDDHLTDRPLRWLAGELVREAAFEALGQELPYEMAVEVVKFDESRSDWVEIHANILVKRNSQKRIAVGRGGEMIKRIGIKSRRQIERLVGCQVNLQLFVKVDPKWLKNARRIESLGYH